jgi:L-iditol 2-dehydrogenase
MTTVKAARYYGSKDIRIEEAILPALKPGELKVWVKACGICGSDLTDWYMEPRAPMFFGHEPTGVVVEVGEGVHEFKAGDRVFVHHHVPCFVCHFCSRGYFTLCETFKETALYPGGFAEYIVVPVLNAERDTLKLPEAISFEEATMIEPIGCCIRGMRRANMRVGDTVVVFGAGFMGLVHVQLARLFGARKVITVDSVDFRLKKALELGADHVIDYKNESVKEGVGKLNEGRGADTVVVSVGYHDALREGIEIAEKGATVYLYAPFRPGTMFPFDLYKFFFSEISFVTTYSASPYDTREALALIESGRIEVGKLITHRFPLDRLGEAMQLAKKAGDSLKIVITI